MAGNPITDGDGYIEVHFPTLETGAANLGAAYQALSTCLEDMDKNVPAQLYAAGQWNSDSQTYYNNKSQANKTLANEMAQYLLAHAQFVSNAHEAYTSTELNNVKVWI